MITISELTKRRGACEVLRGVSLTARPGAVTGFLGPNGAGKSSTMRILLGLDRADGGSALVSGQRYRDLRNPLRSVGSTLDGSGAHRSRTARGHLTWMARSNGIPTRRVSQVLEVVGLSEHASSRVGRFSLGMGQRLGLAGALLGEPEVLVLDEPANGLDPEGIRWLRELVWVHADRGGTVLLSSHLMAEVAAVADDLVVIAGGRIAAAGPLAEVTSGYPTLEDAYFGLTAPVVDGAQR